MISLLMCMFLSLLFEKSLFFGGGSFLIACVTVKTVKCETLFIGRCIGRTLACFALACVRVPTWLFTANDIYKAKLTVGSSSICEWAH